MAERPILFSSPMVRALLSGAKSQTRRVVKPQPEANWCPPEEGIAWRNEAVGFCGRQRVLVQGPDGGPDEDVEVIHFPVQRCPYGVPGDVLYVREAVRYGRGYDGLPPRRVNSQNARVWYEADGHRNELAGILRPGIHMPRWASRLTLRITDVRVERLNDCSEADAIAEGLSWVVPGKWSVAPSLPIIGDDPRRVYAELWDRINGAGAWAENPWVWAVSFERVQP